ncbi:MAG: tetratricopeptide repeat protein [Tepidisphaera sp.]|nr:tetratricopeptide repeat protein [Tepidisphaera sp.]
MPDRSRVSTRRVGSLVAGCAMIAAALGPGCQSLDSVVYRKKATVAPEYNGKEAVVTPAGVDKPMPSAAAGQDSVSKAQSLLAKGDKDAALMEFEKAIEVNPTLTVAYLGAGDIYREKGDYGSAEKNYGKAADLEPTNFGAQYLHGLSLQLLNRLSDAVRAYLRALTIRPDDFNANLNLGTAYLQLNEPDQALPFAQHAAKLNPKSAEARTNLGAAYSLLNRHAEAIVEYQQAAELTELSAPLLLNLANSLGRVGRYEEMVNTLEQLTKTEPTANAYERLGAGLFRLRRYDESLGAYRKAVEIDPNNYPAHNGIGVCLINQWIFSNQTDEPARQEALSEWRKSLQIERDQPIILELLTRYK